MAYSAPGKHYRDGISIFDLHDMFPDEASAREWFESHVWPDGRHCPRCGSMRTTESKHKKMPYWCSDCRSYFSVKTGTALESSKIPLRKWVFAIYLEVTSLKGVSSMKLHRDLKVTQKTAWFMLHRLREAWAFNKGPFLGPAEADETHVGGKLKNMHRGKRKAARDRYNYGKSIVAGVKDRATNKVSAAVVGDTTAYTLQTFIEENVVPDAKVYTDDSRSYVGLIFHEHEAVNHSAGEYVRGDASTQGIESFWSMFKRAYHGTYHHISPKHLQRYVDQFAGKASDREMNTVGQMRAVVAGMIGKRLLYRHLVS